jgi:PAS domain S-box-containing protein
MNIPVVLNSMISGILFYTAYQFLYIGLRNRRHLEYITFGFIVLLQAICALIELFGILSENQHNYLIYRYAYFNITSVINVLFFYFICIVSGFRNKIWTWVYLVLVLFAFLVTNTTATIIFVNHAPHYYLQIIASHFFRPWTVSSTILFGFATSLQFIFLAIFSLFAYRFQLTKNRKKSNFIIYCTLFFILGSIPEFAIDFGKIHYPVSSYFYLILIIYASKRLYKNSETILKNNEQILETIFENTTIAMVLIDHKSEIIKINKASTELGINPGKDIIGTKPGNALNCIIAYRNDGECGHGKECSSCTLWSSIKSTFVNKKNVHKIPYTMNVKRNNGDEYRNILLSTSYFEINKDPMVLLICEDITLMVKTERALMESEYRYKEITRAITDYIYTVIIHDNGEIQTIHTPACFPITGYKAEEFEADPSLWLNIIVNEDREKVLNYMGNQSKGQEIQYIEHRIIHKNGQERWMSNTLVKKNRKSGIDQYDGVISDITHRKHTEVALDNQNKLLNTMLDNLPIGIFMVNVPDGVPLIVNEQAKKLLGQGILPNVTLPNITNVYKAYKTGTDQPYPTEKMPIMMGMKGEYGHVDDMEVEQSDGTRTLLEVVGCPVYDNNNNIWASLVGFYDITARKNAELALRDSEKKLSVIFEYSHVGISLSDHQGNIQYMNPAFCSILDYQPDHVAENSFHLFTDPKLIDSDVELFDKLRKGQLNNLNIEKKFSKINGENIYVQIQVSCFRNAKGEVANFITVVEDITERVNALDSILASEEKFRNIFNTSNDAILITNFESLILEANQTAINRSGYTLDQIINSRLIDLFIAPSDQEAAFEEFSKLAQNQIAFLQSNYINQRGEKVFIEIVGHPINFNGKQLALIVSRNITERIISQQKILNAIIEAEEKERSFFSQELHDGIGPILSTIKLYLEWIQNPNAKSDKSTLLTDALNTVEDAIISIKEISNRLSPNVLTKFGLETAIQSYVKKIESLEKIHFLVKINLPIVRIRPEIEAMLYRVFVEAINNSLKYAKASNIVIQIESSVNGLNAIFSDDGIGFNVNETLIQKTGHGLFNMQNRVETYEGRFSLKSTPGKGTDISITIPISKYMVANL